MIVSPESEVNKNLILKSKDSDEIKDNWYSLGDEIFFRKNKFEFSQKEKNSLKKMLIKSPPPLQYRRKVFNISYFFIIILLFSSGLLVQAHLVN